MDAALTALIDTEARALGFDLVRVAMIGGKSDPTLQVMAERPDTRQLDLSDCEALSRRISEKLDALEEAGKDPIEGAYRLEVSSPGIDRPLTRLKDFADWQGHEARLKLAREVDGAKQVTGDIEGVDGEQVMISGSQGTRTIPFDAIHSAKLLLTDRLIAATVPLDSEGADDFVEAPLDGADHPTTQEED
ncbi:ribosome maturation factor RimP [Sphingomonas rosea]|jgi:ribosome maturation factor RimP|uniref:Ribosome maturation factor RimP n=1 Tax=Sphingomonas rosea TaxID=335605 RepID=A0ABP7U7K4_9SPHN